MEADRAGDVAFAQPDFVLATELVDRAGVDEQVAGLAYVRVR